MDNKFLESTKMLNYKSKRLHALVKNKKWNELDEAVG